MPTARQRKAFDKITKNHDSPSRAMVAAGYDKDTAQKPKNLTESKGFKQLMKESGLDEQLIANALVEDINEKPQRRLDELKFGAELLGMVNKAPQNAFQFNISSIKDKYSE